jgi:hypothetical protein
LRNFHAANVESAWQNKFLANAATGCFYPLGAIESLHYDPAVASVIGIKVFIKFKAAFKNSYVIFQYLLQVSIAGLL